MNKDTHPYFIADGESREETAVMLVGSADEFGIHQREVCAVPGGFRISQRMYDALEADAAEDE